jgi:hypothetical protein
VIVPALIAGGLVLGFVAGRWWALLAAVGVAAYVAVVSEVLASATAPPPPGASPLAS